MTREEAERVLAFATLVASAITGITVALNPQLQDAIRAHETGRLPH